MMIYKKAEVREKLPKVWKRRNAKAVEQMNFG